MKQTRSGKAFEYALANVLADLMNSSIVMNSTAIKAQAYFDQSVEKVRLMRAAHEAITYLFSHDKILQKQRVLSIKMQSDTVGKEGDVRDIIAFGEGFEIGFSAKNRHQAIKHSRLSSVLDFGKEWAGYPVSSNYWQTIKPIFQYLQIEKEKNKTFSQLTDKNSIYKKIILAFQKEFESLCQKHGSDFINKTFRYLIGRHDFYKIINRSKDVVIQSFNLNGTLDYGDKWKIPNFIERIALKPKTISTLLISLDGGWQLSFRLHNATSKVEPSLKFDINFVGLPSAHTFRHIPLT